MNDWVCSVDGYERKHLFDQGFDGMHYARAYKSFGFAYECNGVNSTTLKYARHPPCGRTMETDAGMIAVAQLLSTHTYGVWI